MEMPIQVNGNAPYAPGAGILSLLERARERGLPNPVTKDVLARAGIPDSLAPRTFLALQQLDLIGEDGAWTANLDNLRKAPEAEVPARLAEIIRAVYADVFQYIDPAKDSPQAIRDAFRSYVPHGQQDRMVALFMSLCQRAGMASPDSSPAPREPRATTKIQLQRRKAKVVSGAAHISGSSHVVGASMNLAPPLAGLLTTLPKDGWTQQERDRFVNAFTAMLDYCVPVREAIAPDSEEETE
jgi:hypothetical protein